MTGKVVFKALRRFAVLAAMASIIGLINSGCGSDDDSDPIDPNPGGTGGITQTVSGTIADKDGNPLVGVVVSLSGNGSVQTNAQGRYEFTGVEEGTYTLTPTLSGYDFNPKNTSINVPGNTSGLRFTATERDTNPTGLVYDPDLWKITFPLISSKTGNALEVLNPDFTTYSLNDSWPAELAEWFYKTDEGQAFHCEYTGATTPNSSYGRTEFREMIGGEQHNWQINEKGSRLHCRLKVADLKNGAEKLFFMQIHGGTPSDKPLLKCIWEKGTVRLLTKSGTGLTDYTKAKDGKYTVVGEDWFTCTIDLVPDALSIKINGQTVEIFTYDEVLQHWPANNTYYYKAGNYLQHDIEGAAATVVFSEITVSHGDGLVDPGGNGGNQRPVIISGPSANPKNVTVNLSTALSVGAEDQETDNLNYTWTKLSGPGTVNFGKPGAATTTASFSAVGTYKLQVSVSDGDLDVTGNVQVEVIAASSGPAVWFTSLSDNQDVTATSELAVSINASGDDTRRVKRVALYDNVTNATLGNATELPATFTVDASKVGTLGIRAVAFLDDAEKVKEIITLNIINPGTGGNQRPVIISEPTANPGTVNVDQTTTLSVTAEDPETDNLTYAWTKLSGPGTVDFDNPKAQNTNATFSAAGIYKLEVSVSDGNLDVTGSVTVTVTSDGTVDPIDPNASLWPLVNPSFEESSSVGGWYYSEDQDRLNLGSDSGMYISREEAHYLKVENSDHETYQAIYQPIAGHRYEVTAMVYNRGTVAVEDIGAENEHIETVTTNHGDTWQEVRLEFVSTGSPALLHLKQAPGGGTSYFDMIDVKDISTDVDLNKTPPTKVMRYASQVFDISWWKQTMPINGAEEFYTPFLYKFVSDPWFKLAQDEDGYAIQFRANHAGSSTSGSSNPRSEFREFTQNYHFRNSKSAAAWSNTDGKTHTMWIKQKVTHLTSVKPEVVVGQIHDNSDDVCVFRMHGHERGLGVQNTHANLYITKGNTVDELLVDDNYKLGTVFTVKFISHDGITEFEYNDERLEYQHKEEIAGCYFKVGNYTQSHTGTAPTESNDAYAETYVYDCKVTHE